MTQPLLLEQERISESNSNLLFILLEEVGDLADPGIYKGYHLMLLQILKFSVRF